MAVCACACAGAAAIAVNARDLFLHRDFHDGLSDCALQGALSAVGLYESDLYHVRPVEFSLSNGGERVFTAGKPLNLSTPYVIAQLMSKASRSIPIKPEIKLQVRDAAETKARILDAAQAAFSEKGYSQSGLRDIAMRSGVATSLVIKHFQTKANLFELALRNALHLSQTVSGDKSQFGEFLVKSVLDPNINVNATAMIALSLGDEEAREIAVRVAQENIIGPISAWIGPPEARARAANILMLSAGFALFSRYVNVELSGRARDASAKWVAEQLQSLIDGPDEG